MADHTDLDKWEEKSSNEGEPFTERLNDVLLEKDQEKTLNINQITTKRPKKTGSTTLSWKISFLSESIHHTTTITPITAKNSIKYDATDKDPPRIRGNQFPTLPGVK